jgi:hypothetical protein
MCKKLIPVGSCNKFFNITGYRYICDVIIVNAVNISNFLVCIFFGGLECLSHSFAYVAYFLFRSIESLLLINEFMQSAVCIIVYFTNETVQKF